LSDEGRMQSMRQVGPYAMRIEGELVQATSDDLVLAVSDVVDIRGTHSKWTGESVSLPRSFVSMTYQKQFSRSRTVLLATAVAGGPSLGARRSGHGRNGYAARRHHLERRPVRRRVPRIQHVLSRDGRGDAADPRLHEQHEPGDHRCADPRHDGHVRIAEFLY